MKYAVFLFTVIASLISSPVSLAQPYEQTTTVQPGVFDLRLTAGFGGIENPLKQRQHIRSPLLPEFSYYGDKVYIENLVVGYSLFESPSWMFDAYGYVNSDGYFFAQSSGEKIASIAGLGQTPWQVNKEPLNLKDVERDLSYMAGFNLSRVSSLYRLNFSIAKDVTSVHHGEELSLTLSKPMRWQSLSVNAQIGATYKSSDISDYYYSLTTQENTIYIRQNAVGDTISSWAGLSLRYHFNPTWSLGFSYRHHWFDSKMKASLLVDKTHYSAGFIGVSYRL
ncbi:MipA/OmpV family protein [Thalassotalea ponticola]|uniref:MipA/OmpV family protein n=1 Tax=Thalassotalea ponticola TaxID=1523392 RepID=UPI0025B56BD1|nr:MipA/OmpV family protein [Thalassotalea ponticola]MDN3651839.1 MipA/OmpV family protein [Thalassotalea ponticola]